MKKLITYFTLVVLISLSQQTFGQSSRNDTNLQDSDTVTIKIFIQFTVKPTGKFENVKVVDATCNTCDLDILNQEKINEVKREASLHVIKSEGHYQTYDHDTTLVEPRIFILPIESLLKEKTKPNNK